MNEETDTHYRSVIKAISWRAGGTVVTCIVAWLLTGSLDLAARIGLLDTVIKIGAFYAHVFGTGWILGRRNLLNITSKFIYKNERKKNDAKRIN
jgi:hypothetical protein